MMGRACIWDPASISTLCYFIHVLKHWNMPNKYGNEISSLTGKIPQFVWGTQIVTGAPASISTNELDPRPVCVARRQS